MPSCAAAAPSLSIAAMSLPSISPPEAITGTGTAFERARDQLAYRHHRLLERLEERAAMRTSLLALAHDVVDASAASAFASSTVVAVPDVKIPALRIRASASAVGMPNVKLNTAGRASITAANWSSNGLCGLGGSTGGGRPSSACTRPTSSSIGAGSTLRSGS